MALSRFDAKPVWSTSVLQDAGHIDQLDGSYWHEPDLLRGPQTNADAYTKEFVPLARASIKNGGGKAVAASQNPTSLEGTPQTSRVTINVFDGLEKAQAWRTGTEYTAARKIGDKYATFRAYVVEGLPQ
jgi:uncharacterized protein (DUF1330 family)